MNFAKWKSRLKQSANLPTSSVRRGPSSFTLNYATIAFHAILNFHIYQPYATVTHWLFGATFSACVTIGIELVMSNKLTSSPTSRNIQFRSSTATRLSIPYVWKAWSVSIFCTAVRRLLATFVTIVSIVSISSLDASAIVVAAAQLAVQRTTVSKDIYIDVTFPGLGHNAHLWVFKVVRCLKTGCINTTSSCQGNYSRKDGLLSLGVPHNSCLRCWIILRMEVTWGLNGAWAAKSNIIMTDCARNIKDCEDSGNTEDQRECTGAIYIYVPFVLAAYSLWVLITGTIVTAYSESTNKTGSLITRAWTKGSLVTRAN